jgi:hypothetical protein
VLAGIHACPLKVYNMSKDKTKRFTVGPPAWQIDIWPCQAGVFIIKFSKCLGLKVWGSVGPVQMSGTIVLIIQTMWSTWASLHSY